MPSSAKDLVAAVRPKSVIFGLALQNIPTINLRHQYACDRSIITDEHLADKIRAWKFQRTDGVTVTYPEPDAYFTILFRSTIVGIECTLQASAVEELSFAKRLTAPLENLVRHPSKLASSMADAYYNKIPGLVNVRASLKVHNKNLWRLVRQFYEEVRNPISHGYQLRDVQAESLRATFGMFDQLYGWIDTWSDSNRIQKILASTTFPTLK